MLHTATNPVAGQGTGLLLRSGRNIDARFIGKQIAPVATWQVTSKLDLSASLGAFDPDRVIRDTWAARTIRMAGAMATFPV